MAASLNIPFLVILFLFAAVQVIAIVSFFAIRYHFVTFAIPKDLNIRRLLGICALGILAGCLASGWIILSL